MVCNIGLGKMLRIGKLKSPSSRDSVGTQKMRAVSTKPTLSQKDLQKPKRLIIQEPPDLEPDKTDQRRKQKILHGEIAQVLEALPSEQVGEKKGSRSSGQCQTKHLVDAISTLPEHKFVNDILEPEYLNMNGILGLLVGLDSQGLRSRVLETFDYYKTVKGKTPAGKTVFYTKLISVLSRGKRNSSLVMSLFREMKKDGIRMEIAAYNAGINSCGKAKDVHGAFELFEHLCDSGLRPNVITYTALINVCSMVKDVTGALEVFNWMTDVGVQPNLATYTTLMACLQRCGEWEEALLLYRQMEVKGIKADLKAYNAMIAACGRGKSWEEAWFVFHSMKRMGVEPNTVSFNSLISACERCGEYERAQEVFLKMCACSKQPKSRIQPNLITYNTMLTACASKGRVEEALELIDEMKAKQLRIDAITLSSLLAACDKGGQYEVGIFIFQQLTVGGRVKPNLICYTSLISCLSKAGFWKRAMEVFENLSSENLKPDLITYSTIILACERNYQMEEALHLYEKMKKIGLKPTGNIYLALINGCEKTGAWEKALDLFNTMVSEGCSMSSSAFVAKKILYFWPKLAKHLPPQIVEAATATIDSGRAARKWVSRG